MAGEIPGEEGDQIHGDGGTPENRHRKTEGKCRIEKDEVAMESISKLQSPRQQPTDHHDRPSSKTLLNEGALGERVGEKRSQIGDETQC
jgi:hypothetical protein